MKLKNITSHHIVLGSLDHPVAPGAVIEISEAHAKLCGIDKLVEQKKLEHVEAPKAEKAEKPKKQQQTEKAGG